MRSSSSSVGISGFGLYAPPLRVSLERWCEWTGRPWEKISSVVGRSFRQAGRHESIYTMAANAALRLIDAYDVDPRDVGFLGFGTESSTDNAAGAVIIRGMLDRALEAQGRPRLSRSCEVPEVKHACLGGIYALKSALRYLATDGRGRQAIVIAGDIAEYERGSTGEQTQGAGCIAMLLEGSPKLCALDLSATGTSSDYRGLDFRKPVARHGFEDYTPTVDRMHDFPVFNGKYSTFCYLDAVTHAARDMAERAGRSPLSLYEDAGAIFFHRPYHWMPIQAMATLYLWSLGHDEDGRKELRGLCEKAGADPAAVLREITSSADLYAGVIANGVEAEPYPAASKLAKEVRRTARFEALLKDKMRLGSDAMMELGNIYTAALPAWLAAGLEEAQHESIDLTGRTLIAIGYGSGDAAEAMPLKVVPGWEKAAAKIGFARALEGYVDLTQHQYEALHDGREVLGLDYRPSGELVVERVGREVGAEFQDVGIEYYAWVPDAKAARKRAAG